MTTERLTRRPTIERGEGNPVGRSQGRHRRLWWLAGVLMLLVPGVVVGTGGPASAEDCRGELVGHYPARNAAGTTMAYVDIYYRSGGWNCARLNSNGSWWGVRKHMRLELKTCTQTRDPGDWFDCTQRNGDNAYDEDSGDFLYYAGPVEVYAPGRCVGWYGRVEPLNNDRPELVAVAQGAGHCG